MSERATGEARGGTVTPAAPEKVPRPPTEMASRLGEGTTVTVALPAEGAEIAA